MLLVILLHVLLALPLPGWRLLDGSLVIVRGCCGFPLLGGILLLEILGPIVVVGALRAARELPDPEARG